MAAAMEATTWHSGQTEASCRNPTWYPQLPMGYQADAPWDQSSSAAATARMSFVTSRRPRNAQAFPSTRAKMAALANQAQRNNAVPRTGFSSLFRSEEHGAPAQLNRVTRSTVPSMCPVLGADLRG